MAYCPECGEKISDSDTFCAYCGISLQPVAPVSGEPNAGVPDAAAAIENVSQASENTPVSPAPVAAEISDAAKNPAPVEEFGLNPFVQLQATENPGRESAESVGVEKDAEVARVSPNENDEDFYQERAAGSELSKSENAVFELPENARSDQSPVDYYPESTGSGIHRDEDASASSAQQSANENFAGNYERGNENTTESYSALETPFELPSKTPETPQPEAAEPDDDAYNADFEKTVPYMPANSSSREMKAPLSSSIANSEPESKSENLPSPVSDSGYTSFSAIPTPNRTEAISMPQTPIEGSPHDSLEPKLVSVNILPDFNGAAKRSAEGDFAPESVSVTNDEAEKPAEKASLSANPTSAKEKEVRSYTSPNFGMTETDGKKSTKLKPLEEGTVLNGRYEIIRKIGGGGMGAVYLASDRNLGGVLRAVKEMVQSYIEDAQQEKAVNDFRRESLLLTSLEHPSIPTIFDYFYDEKECRFYLVMKYISGGDLAARLKSAPEGRVDEKIVAEWAIQIADVLDYLHNRQPPIVYRDLKPSNVMIDGNSGRVMIIDFGIARWVNKEEKGVTAVGTMGYAPPELFSGNVEPRSDIYSLGSTMFHLLTGADPQSNPLLIFDFHKNPRPRQINSRLSDQIEQILVRSVEYNAEHRFASAAELRDALTAHLENLKKGTVTFGAGEAAKQTPVAAAQPVFCGFCGQKILVTDMFCPFCGAQQPTAGASPSASLKPAFGGAKQTARLLIIGTNELDAPQFQLDKDTSLVGRRDPMSNIFPEVDLSKFDPQTKISRRHARIWREGAAYMLEDLGSSNGTILMSGARDSLRLPPHQPHVLASGDKIRVGDTMLHFFVG